MVKLAVSFSILVSHQGQPEPPWVPRGQELQAWFQGLLIPASVAGESRGRMLCGQVSEFLLLLGHVWGGESGERANSVPDKRVRVQGTKSQGAQVLRVTQRAHTG